MPRHHDQSGSTERRGLRLALLPEALADSDWTTAPVVQRSGYQGLPPALTLDIDETVLDNSPYQVLDPARGVRR